MIPTNTLGRFLRAAERRHPGSSGELTELISSIALGVKIISQIVATAGVKGLYGYTDRMNTAGDRVHLLDEEADEVLVELLGSLGHFGLLVSEERDTVVATQSDHQDANYVVAFDPLDGSSNIGSNIPVGTIFSILRKKEASRGANVDDFLQPGRSIVAAGYSVYGAKTSFVYSVGEGVHGFTLDPGIGEFLLTAEKIETPVKGSIFSANEGNSAYWSREIHRFVDELKRVDPERGTPYTSRYVGSLVADFDRNLKKGGIFLYPADAKHPKGRLRLLYECMPLAFIADQAGGRALNGTVDLLDTVPTDIHQRSAFIAGGKFEIEWYERVVRESLATAPLRGCT